MRKETVLGLSVGTQLMGLSLVRNDTLVDWQVKNFEGKWTKIKLKIILLSIERYIKQNAVTVVKLKVPESCRSSPAVKQLTYELVRLCERENVPVGTCTIADLKLFYDVRNKRELMQTAVMQYPELTYMLTKANEVKRIYYAKMFEAVLATLL
jgi:hypothetical protein